jgi:copper ion binding protein
MEKQTLKVRGMSCEHCVRAVSKALEELPGLSDVRVELKSSTASFKYDPAKTDLAAIEAAIVEAGYEAAP